ncbi:MAG: hypothetical protein Q4C50_06210 [Eubacteriales bacterium]|nr:hypothetical protein [Eubacteriales bacterium]
MRKAGTLIFIILSAVLFTGCTAVELEDRTFPQAMELCLYRGEYAGGFGGFMVSGASAEEIVRSYQAKTDKYLDLGHVKVIILGKELLAEKELAQKILRELEQMPLISGNCLILKHNYQDGRSVLAQLEEQGVVPGEYLCNLYRSYPDSPAKSTVTLAELLSRF